MCPMYFKTTKMFFIFRTRHEHLTSTMLCCANPSTFLLKNDWLYRFVFHNEQLINDTDAL